VHAPDDNTPPSRLGLKRLITPWEYRHPYGSMAARFTGSGFQLGIGLVLLSFASKADTDAERRKFYRLAACSWCPQRGTSWAAFWT
jgi:hypothetical protein